jgi:asparagine synthase (glutamine-hydrolysing)
MCTYLIHRGPDDSGILTDGSVALGHRRLSIIDLSDKGRNPLSNEDRSVWIVLNGEIYNYRQLRAWLIDKGHFFRSRTDTEVIVHLYEEMGADCVSKLNGMFAFAIWDANRREIFLARDRFGVKPLYYTRTGPYFSFASEVKAFLALPGFAVRADPCALAEHFTFQNTFGERTFFKDVKLLEAGSCLVYRNGNETVRKYWDLVFQTDDALSVEQWAAGLRERFEAAVTGQLMSDVPLGSYLSGGMDTGSISAVAARKIEKMHTFTCGFDVPENATELEVFFDERKESRELSAYLGTVHHELVLDHHALFPAMPLVTWHLDEPRVGISYQVYYTAEMIRRHVTVVLSGVGGDELFAGYPWRYEQILSAPESSFEESYYPLCIRFLTDRQKQTFFTPELLKSLNGFSTFDSVYQVMKGYTGDKDNLHRALFFDFKTFLNGLLIVDDKLSMAHSVEARVPFLDNELVDYVSRIPSGLKLQPGQSKIILREAMRGLVPEETIFRRKQGFTPPDQTWYKGKSLKHIKELILGPQSRERQYFRPEAIETILDEHLQDKHNHRFLIWSLMCFEWWNRLFIDRESLPLADYDLHEVTTYPRDLPA